MSQNWWPGLCTWIDLNHAIRPFQGELIRWGHQGHQDWKGRVGAYCAVQAMLLTPLTFAWHCLSPLATFTSGAYFFHNGRQWQWICEVYSANLKGIFEGPLLECAWQQETTCCLCIRMPPNCIFFSQTCNLLPAKKQCKDTLFFHPPSTFPR